MTPRAEGVASAMRLVVESLKSVQENEAGERSSVSSCGEVGSCLSLEAWSASRCEGRRSTRGGSRFKVSAGVCASIHGRVCECAQVRACLHAHVQTAL